VTGHYREDLAYIHDVGHCDLALGAALGIMEIFARNSIRGGLVVDLGMRAYGDYPLAEGHAAFVARKP
jgi:hypothetical protein